MKAKFYSVQIDEPEPDETTVFGVNKIKNFLGLESWLIISPKAEAFAILNEAVKKSRKIEKRLEMRKRLRVFQTAETVFQNDERIPYEVMGRILVRADLYTFAY